MSEPCWCGHTYEEHEPDDSYPGDWSCKVEGEDCRCIHYEAADEEEA